MGLVGSQSHVAAAGGAAPQWSHCGGAPQEGLLVGSLGGRSAQGLSAGGGCPGCALVGSWLR